MKPTIYLSAQMRGVPYFNYPAFDEARDTMKMDGWTVVSPADIDRENGFDAMTLPSYTDWNVLPVGFSLSAAIKRDVAAVLECDAIFMLIGWENSAGATAEHALACWAGKQIIYQEPQVAATVLKHAVRAIRQTMREGLGKHGLDSWIGEPRDNHLDKCLRHGITYRLQADGNSPRDAEDHMRLCLCRAAMTYAQKEEQRGN